MLPLRSVAMVGVLAGVGLVPLLPPQDPADDPPPVVIDIPEELQPFWRQYEPAKGADDEEAMDKAVRLRVELAERTLNVLLDDLARVDEAEIRDEARVLAWSLDRVKGLTRFIERTRLVIDMDMVARRKRHAALTEFDVGFRLLEEAKLSPSPAAWATALRKFTDVEQALEGVGDWEYAIASLEQMAAIEAQLGNPWEQSQHLQQIIDLSGRLAYPEFRAENAQALLNQLKAAGIDPAGPRPEGDPAGAAPAEGGEGGGDGGGATSGGTAAAGGRGSLTSFAAGSTELLVPLVLDAPKKGVAPVALPSFSPIEQHYLWTFRTATLVDKNGPSPFDMYRAVPLKPWGTQWKISRDGLEYSLDTNDDGEADVSFKPDSTPQRVDVPAPDGQSFYPLMISAPSDRESMFGLDLNYSPQPTFARLRFYLGGTMTGEVLDETWHVYDSNLTGLYGDVVECIDDLITEYDAADPTRWHETDAVLVGKAKLALPWSAVLPVGEAFYRATLKSDGTGLTLRQLDLPTGQVKLECDTAAPPTHVVLAELDQLAGSYFNVVPAKKGGTVTLPAGKYQLVFGRIESGRRTSMQQVSIYQGHAQPFELAAGATHTLSLGAPFSLRAKSRKDGNDLVVNGKSLRVFGRSGEEYAMFYDDTLQPEVEARTAEGKKLGKPQKMPRAGIEEWQDPESPSSTIWFPLDVRFENPKGEKAQIHLTQKAQALLGGPFDSDWMP